MAHRNTELGAFRSPTFNKSRGSWALPIIISLASGCLLGQPASAQIAGDATLGTQVNGSLTAPCSGFCQITEGSARGRNLYHSFQQFSLPNGDFAAFITNPAIQNVIVRVTGIGQPFISNINGTIATTDPTISTIIPTNFFLLNPNGIVFGPNARIFVGGSFLASTAERMLFQDGTHFSTRDPTPTPLLTISVPIGLQMGQNPGEIQMKDSLLSTLVDNFTDVALVGGNVTLDNSRIGSSGHRLELGGVGDNSNVDLLVNGDRLSLNFPQDSLRRDINLTNEAILYVAASKGGEVCLSGQNIVIDRSSIFAGIAAGIDNEPTNQAGNITINAAANLQLLQGGFITNVVGDNGIGQGGDVSITALGIQVQDNSAIATITFGQGDAGNVELTANTLALDGIGSVIGSQVLDVASGRSGDVTINTNSLTVTNGARIDASTFGKGNAGNIRVKAATIALDGLESGIGSQIFDTGQGRSGDITVETGSLTVTNGAVISASTLGNGDAGDVQVIANTIILNGSGSGIGSQVFSTGIGQGGDVLVEVSSLTMTDETGISASTLGRGNAGNVLVKANTITLDGTAPNGQGSGIASQVLDTATGQGGNVTIEVGSLTATNGAGIATTTLGNGDAGNVQVRANTIIFDGAASGIGSNVGRTGIGRGGNIIVQAGSLALNKGAAISASTLGNGNGGNIQVSANTIVIDGTSLSGQVVSGIGSQIGPTGIGRGGDVTLWADSLTVSNGATISSGAFGNGGAGNLDITARSIQLDQGTINAIASSGDGANINLNIGELLLMRNGSQISTSAGLAGAGGDGGNITINAPRGFIVGVKRENSDITANAFTGSGGRINITAQGVYGLQFRPQLTEFSDITASSRFGINGTVALNILGVDPTRSLFVLPTAPLDPRMQMDDRCKFGSKFSRSSFIYTGRGGFPTDPADILRDEESQLQDSDWIVWEEKAEGKNTGNRSQEGRGQGAGEKHTASPPSPPSPTSPSPHSPTSLPSPIIEATGWVQTSDGQIYLVADAPNGGLSGPWLPMLDCVNHRQSRLGQD